MRMCRIIKYFELLKVNYVLKIEFKKCSMFLSSRFTTFVLAGFGAVEAVFLSQNKTKSPLVPVKNTPNKKNPLA